MGDALREGGLEVDSFIGIALLRDMHVKERMSG